MDQNGRAQNALQYAVECAMKHRDRRGCHTTNLLDTLQADIKHRNLNPCNTTDLELLRSTATDRARWREMMQKD